ncbi:MAG: translation initiation factor [Elusimicrobia bacterium]|nr:translation initiation factor [Elusimicrobiota bacterium]
MTRPQPDPVYLSFLRQGKGSGVTRIEGLVMHPSLKENLLKEFKRRFACGGTLSEGTLELQGDHRDKIEAELRAKGHEVRRKG